MLVVKQIVPAQAATLIYECYDNNEMVGRLLADWREDGVLQARLTDTRRIEAGRTLVAKLERDAQAQGITELYLEARDDKERNQFLPAGYESDLAGSLLMYKRFQA